MAPEQLFGEWWTAGPICTPPAQCSSSASPTGRCSRRRAWSRCWRATSTPPRRTRGSEREVPETLSRVILRRWSGGPRIAGPPQHKFSARAGEGLAHPRRLAESPTASRAVWYFLPLQRLYPCLPLAYQAVQFGPTFSIPPIGPRMRDVCTDAEVMLCVFGHLGSAARGRSYLRASRPSWRRGSAGRRSGPRAGNGESASARWTAGSSGA